MIMIIGCDDDDWGDEVIGIDMNTPYISII